MKTTRKTELRYRQGEQGRCCIYCENFRRSRPGIVMRAGGVPGPSPAQCNIIGLKTGKNYNIDPYDVCDAYEAFKPKGKIR